MAKKKKEELLNQTDNVLLESRMDIDKVKEDLTNYIDEKINKTFIEEIDKANRKLLRDKSRRLFIKNIIIILLIAIIGFLMYLLYTNHYFDHYFNRNTHDEPVINEPEKNNEKEKEEPKKDEKKEEVVPKEPTLDELKKEYSHLLDNYYISDTSSYLVDFYNGKLTDNIKKYITLNSFDFDSLKQEEDYNIINEETFKIIYNKLFDGLYESGSFEYNNNKIRYVSIIDSYMTSELLKKENNNITREITNIKVNNDEVIIETIEGIIKDNKLYNIIYNSEVENYKGDTLINYSDSLNKVIYTFKNNKLISLGK